MWPDWAINCTLGNFSKPVATIILPRLPIFLGNFCKEVKIFHVSSGIIFGQLLLTFGGFLLVTLHPSKRRTWSTKLGINFQLFSTFFAQTNSNTTMTPTPTPMMTPTTSSWAPSTKTTNAFLWKKRGKENWGQHWRPRLWPRRSAASRNRREAWLDTNSSYLIETGRFFANFVDSFGGVFAEKKTDLVDWLLTPRRFCSQFLLLLVRWVRSRGRKAKKSF